MPSVSNWKSDGKKAIAERRAYFEKLAGLLRVPGATVALDLDSAGETWRDANLRVNYPGRHRSELRDVVTPFVQLEVGNARVTPFIARDLTSFVHENLLAQGQLAAFDDNRPRAVRCVHPLVTLLEKLDALQRRFRNESTSAARFVRHYEDAARIIAAIVTLPPLSDHADVRALAYDMHALKQLAALPAASDPALAPSNAPRWETIRGAHEAIRPMFWGPRMAIEDACAAIRAWIANELA